VVSDISKKKREASEKGIKETENKEIIKTNCILEGC